MDSLKDAKACTRDAALMAQVGINTIYVMAIDPKVNHDECFSIFNSVGIYVMVVLRKDGVLDTSYEDFTRSYTTDFLRDMFEIIDAVKDYDNLLGFDLGVLPTYYSWWAETPQVSYADVMKMYRVSHVKLFHPITSVNVNPGLRPRHKRIHLPARPAPHPRRRQPAHPAQRRPHRSRRPNHVARVLLHMLAGQLIHRLLALRLPLLLRAAIL
jgi:hypothetical protein